MGFFYRKDRDVNEFTFSTMTYQCDGKAHEKRRNNLINKVHLNRVVEIKSTVFFFQNVMKRYASKIKS